LLDPEKISKSSDDGGEIEVLKPENGAIEFEKMRLATDSFAKKARQRPKAFIALIGNNPTMRSARGQFSSGFIGCGGFEIVDGVITSSNDEAIKKALDQNAEITVMCGSDDDYVTIGIEFAKKFKEVKKDGLLVLAGYPTDSIEALKEAGVDEFVHIRADLISTLKSFQQKLNII
jgi:methylmalonyl-CoA mutase